METRKKIRLYRLSVPATELGVVCSLWWDWDRPCKFRVSPNKVEGWACVDTTDHRFIIQLSEVIKNHSISTFEE